MDNLFRDATKIVLDIPEPLRVIEITISDSPYIIAQREAEKQRAIHLAAEQAKRSSAAKQTAKTTIPSGDLLERIAQCESGGNYKAQNPRSTASGKYQFVRGTWSNFGGYKNAKDAPPEIQDEKARQVFAEQGSRPWNASRHCWGR